MTKTLDNTISQWASLGAGFGATPTAGNIDLERLLLDTARHMPEMARLYIMAATWLNVYGDMIAKHRLKRLIHDELELEFQPTLGLLLDTAQKGTRPLEFESIIKHLGPAAQARPLFKSAQRNAKRAELAKRKASDISRRWNLWAQPVSFKHDALRPASWLMNERPELRTSADFKGDLRASILAALRHDRGAGESELKLAACAGGSRAQVRNGLRNLELTGRVSADKAHGANRREITLAGAA